jgi:hypothetical protein
MMTQLQRTIEQARRCVIDAVEFVNAAKGEVPVGACDLDLDLTEAKAELNTALGTLTELADRNL